MKTLKNIAAVACVTALAVPAGVSAKGPSGDHGKSELHKQTTQTHVSKRCNKQPKVGFILGGTLDPSSTADNIVVVVKSANKHSRPFVVDGKYTLPAGTTVKFEGANPFTTTPTPDLTKYKVKVIGKVMRYKKGCTAATAPAPTVRKATIKAPDATPEQEQPAAQSA